MKFGLLLPPELGRSADPDWLNVFASNAESLGYDEISVVEHSVVISNTTSRYPYSSTGTSPLADDCVLPDPLEVLTFIAALTTRIGLATAVLVLPNHHPVMLAKRLATLDRLSGGRLRVVIGLGWMREEIEACGGTFDGRGAQAEDAIRAMQALWADCGSDGATFHSEHYNFSGAHSWPKPLQLDGIPILIGGHSLAAARRAGRIGAGFQPLGLAGAELEAALAAMRAEAVRVGRDPSTLNVVLGSTLRRIDRDGVSALEAAGADRIVLSPSRGTDSWEGLLDQMTRCAERLELPGA